MNFLWAKRLLGPDPPFRVLLESFRSAQPYYAACLEYRNANPVASYVCGLYAAQLMFEVAGEGPEMQVQEDALGDLMTYLERFEGQVLATNEAYLALERNEENGCDSSLNKAMGVMAHTLLEQSVAEMVQGEAGMPTFKRLRDTAVLYEVIQGYFNTVETQKAASDETGGSLRDPSLSVGESAAKGVADDDAVKGAPSLSGPTKGAVGDAESVSEAEQHFCLNSRVIARETGELEAESTGPTREGHRSDGKVISDPPAEARFVLSGEGSAGPHSDVTHSGDESSLEDGCGKELANQIPIPREAFLEVCNNERLGSTFFDPIRATDLSLNSLDTLSQTSSETVRRDREGEEVQELQRDSLAELTELAFKYDNLLQATNPIDALTKPEIARRVQYCTFHSLRIWTALQTGGDVNANFDFTADLTPTEAFSDDEISNEAIQRLITLVMAEPDPTTLIDEDGLVRAVFPDLPPAPACSEEAPRTPTSPPHDASPPSKPFVSEASPSPTPSLPPPSSVQANPHDLFQASQGLEEAQRYARFAISALNYDDLATAELHLERALAAVRMLQGDV